MTFGDRRPDADFRATDVEVIGRRHDVRVPPRRVGRRRSTVPLLGAHSACRPALAALAVGDHFGVDRRRRGGRASAGPPAVAGRLRPLPGRGGSLVLDDTYNAAPRSVHGRPGHPGRPARRAPASPCSATWPNSATASEELHRQVGRRAAEVVDLLVTHGNAATWIGRRRRSGPGSPADRVAITFTAEDAAAEAAPHLGPGAVVLVKGSAVARMERVVERLLADGVRSGRAAGAPGPGLEVAHASSSPTGRPGSRSTCRPSPTTSGGWPPGPPGPR